MKVDVEVLTEVLHKLADGIIHESENVAKELHDKIESVFVPVPDSVPTDENTPDPAQVTENAGSGNS